MTPKPAGWDELHLAENPAVELLQSLGYTYVPPEALDPERASLKETVLAGRLAAALKRLNPWLSGTNVAKAVKAVTQVPAAGLAEANQTLYTSLTYGVALEQDRGGGRKGHTVRFLDFERPERNEFVVTRQYRVLGSKKHVIPDVVAFVNGLPLAVIECKSPTIGDAWKAEAVKQLRRYQEADPRWKDQGAPKLFEAAQVLVGTCGERAVYGTVGTPERFFLEWKEPYPLSIERLGERLGRAPTRQDVLLYGLLEPGNLLDIVRNFVVFEVEGGRTVRKLTRYRQFIAVNEAMRRIRTARRPSARGGVVWHTQGSGKSLTMLWLALKLRRDEAQQQPAVVIVTDRTKLDRQIAGVFEACGFPNPERADSVRGLREILEHPTGRTVMTTIQKFQEVTGAGGSARRGAVHPTLSEAANIFVMVDEAHRTQYKSLAANMRKALPNACFLGFTGTPIDKKDRSTLRTFGPYIDTYTIEQAVRDKATVPIFYESRLPELQIIGQTLDQVFDRVFADRSEDERAAIRQRFATEQAVAGAPRRIEAVCLDLIDHFTRFIAPNGFKAQVVASSRHAAVTFKETLDRLNGPESALIMSAGHNDEARRDRRPQGAVDRAAPAARRERRPAPRAARVRQRRERALSRAALPPEGASPRFQRGRPREAARGLAARVRPGRCAAGRAGARRARRLVPVPGGRAAARTGRGVAGQGRRRAAPRRRRRPAQALGKLRPPRHHPPELAHRPGPDAPRRLRRRPRARAPAAPRPRPRLLAGRGPRHARLRAAAGGAAALRLRPGVVVATRTRTLGPGALPMRRLLGARHRQRQVPRESLARLAAGVVSTGFAPDGQRSARRTRARDPAAAAHARSTSNDAKSRLCRLNSTAIRWMGSPRPRYLSA